MVASNLNEDNIEVISHASNSLFNQRLSLTAYMLGVTNINGIISEQCLLMMSNSINISNEVVSDNLEYKVCITLFFQEKDKFMDKGQDGCLKNCVHKDSRLFGYVAQTLDNIQRSELISTILLHIFVP